MAKHTALIAGVTGVVGRALARTLAARPDWSVIGLARRVPAAGLPCPVVALDASDREACFLKLREFGRVTHLLYCARAAHVASVKEPVEANVALLRNVLDAVEAASPVLQHVHFVQGSKVYGSDLGPYKTPARESDPRVADRNWYYAQEDLVVGRARERGWAWTASRPHGVCDAVPGHARSMTLMIGVYAAVRRALGLPFSFPGTTEAFHSLYQSVDATLLADAIAWITTHPACANNAYNVTNGDYIRWENLWPRLAQFFGMETGPVETQRLVQTMSDKGPIWDTVVRSERLVPTPFERAGVWSYADFTWLRGHDKMSDTMKLRKSGFAGCMDTEQMILDHLSGLRDARILP